MDRVTTDGGAGVEARVRALLAARRVAYAEREHPRARTAEAAARARETPLEIGAKTLVLRVGDAPWILVLSAAARVDSKRLRRAFGVRTSRFADREELDSWIGVEPGAVPPFGRPVFDLPLAVDRAFVGPGRVAFTPGRHDLSFVLDRRDWLETAAPERVLPVTRDA